MLDSTGLRGILPALVTPVKSDDTIDTKATDALFNWLQRQGVDGVVPLGGTGEYGALSRGERIRFVELSAKAFGGKVPVVPGVLDPGFHDAMESARDFAAAGADALLVITPYYTNPTQAGIRDYFLRYADQSPVPILIYEIPYRTRIAIDPEVLHQLSAHERIIGMKACNTDMYHYLRVMAGLAPSFSMLSGEDSLFPFHVAAGAKGGIVVTANLLPKVWRRLFDLAESGNAADALALHRELIPFMNMAFAETNPGPMKSVMDLIGVDAPHMLAPLRQPASELRDALHKECSRLLEKYELDNTKLAS
ncbi:4-hydroxy-tetrahydrodipicolinate synthase [Sinorhizobium medicae]|uniref:4-hydroxy-tetrahydrodipicolinate synthase n=1 Tax=Sinorhizobium medicae (strain WSM419) TaxID=366394 RepID=A6UKQ2_SINMW|nr:4-hydroxy-tetrahydrodipicolinate synthase [Sinorhizobium medicae]ABR64232.1 dihydrodipicolinate synthetase [Sinorhizobium medicae WSM419]MDX0430665.1 4-hydroxy-tetrahydrodipicolinate synthase [Sinorhizobium medicae]MDX0445221.1 4-hydroxy-tetrahydrodipicolinate synthase [Sinorhizobium medicae]MDX0489757.1 4-hydroxy-tetrahydrodipicolinate synthase [Sinorhizobium medicae]MDX0523583.1 4-hydroxy-tetrahydrodipicolinate synthase [Sinorhizobium medicae]